MGHGLERHIDNPLKEKRIFLEMFCQALLKSRLSLIKCQVNFLKYLSTEPDRPIIRTQVPGPKSLETIKVLDSLQVYLNHLSRLCDNKDFEFSIV